jgi:hypothetical protein
MRLSGSSDPVEKLVGERDRDCRTRHRQGIRSFDQRHQQIIEKLGSIVGDL